jgi:CheY-like chemotaxis protein
MTILDFSQLNSLPANQAALVIHRSSVLMSAIVKKAIDQLADSLPDGVSLIVNLPAEDLHVHADEAKVVQVLYSLLHNATSFTASGSISVQVRSCLLCPQQLPTRVPGSQKLPAPECQQISPRKDEPIPAGATAKGRRASATWRDLQGSEMSTGVPLWVVVGVEDTGIGIPPDFLPSIWQPFRQADESRHRVHRGVGLSLSLAKRLVELHGGQIGIASTVGVGTLVEFTLPLVQLSRRTNGASTSSVHNEAPQKSCGDSMRSLDELQVGGLAASDSRASSIAHEESMDRTRPSSHRGGILPIEYLQGIGVNVRKIDAEKTTSTRTSQLSVTSTASPCVSKTPSVGMAYESAESAADFKLDSIARVDGSPDPAFHVTDVAPSYCDDIPAPALSSHPISPQHNLQADVVHAKTDLVPTSQSARESGGERPSIPASTRPARSLRDVFAAKRAAKGAAAGEKPAPATALVPNIPAVTQNDDASPSKPRESELPQDNQPTCGGLRSATAVSVSAGPHAEEEMALDDFRVLFRSDGLDELCNGDLRQCRLLAVDDMLVNLKVVERMLKQGGFENVVCVDSGEAALRAIFDSSGAYDCVLLDVMMPRMDGFEVVRRIRERFDRVTLPILHLTAMTRMRDMVFGLSNGANDWVSKPFSTGTMLLRVRQLLLLKKTAEKHIV